MPTLSSRRALVLSSVETGTAVAITERLISEGYETRSITGTRVESADVIDAFVYDPGLVENAPLCNAAEQLISAVERLRPRFRSGRDGGARIVVITSRDGLGWPSRPDLAAEAGALVSAARSLALRLGRSGITVNVVSALPPEGSPLRDAERPRDTHLYEPEELTPHPVTTSDIADTTAFLLDPRSGYITGQVLHCCGGASLLSSLSV